MKLKAPKLEIPQEEPFKYDLLGRKGSADALTELLKSTEEPLVLCINAGWGDGKSTFISMWQQSLVNQGFNTLHFNAWENDFSDDAFVSLIAELELGIDNLSLKGKEKTAIQKQFDKAKKLGMNVIKRVIPTAVKVTTAGLVDLDEISEEALAGLGEKFAADQIKQYEESKQSVAGFREALSNLAAQIAATNEGDKQLPLVIFVDELDRCRPPYAIKVLEAVKHFFSVENVVFVLALDKRQLGHSICSMYGAGIDVAGYLRRFIDIDYTLPVPNKGAFSKAQFTRYGLVDLFQKRRSRDAQYEFGQIDELFAEFFIALDFTLREQERAFTTLSLAIRTTPEHHKLYIPLLGILIILKIKNHDLYREFVAASKTASDVIEYLRSSRLGNILNRDRSLAIIIEAYLLCCQSPRFDIQSVAISSASAEQTATPEYQQNQKLVRILGALENEDAYGVLNYVVAKIDMVANFRQ